jgi:hypothetical protein
MKTIKQAKAEKQHDKAVNIPKLKKGNDVFFDDFLVGYIELDKGCASSGKTGHCLKSLEARGIHNFLLIRHGEKQTVSELDDL